MIASLAWVVRASCVVQECGRKIRDAAELQAAQEALMPSAAKLWAPAEHWRVRQIRSGVRALPPRTEQGAIPLAGRVHEGSRSVAQVAHGLLHRVDVICILPYARYLVPGGGWWEAWEREAWYITLGWASCWHRLS